MHAACRLRLGANGQAAQGRARGKVYGVRISLHAFSLDSMLAGMIILANSVATAIRVAEDEKARVARAFLTALAGFRIRHDGEELIKAVDQ
jgi:hypothetical protein